MNPGWYLGAALLLSAVPTAARPPAAAPPACRADQVMHSILADRRGRILVAAHRGAHDVAPENSLEAIDGAVAAGADIVEIDARVTRDGVAVLMHDEDVARTTDGAGRVDQLDWATLRTFRLRRADGTLGAARVPSLAEALERANGRIVIDLDLKADRLGPILDQVAAQGLAGRIIFYHSDPAVLRRVRARFAAAVILPLATSGVHARALATELQAPLVHLREGFASAALAEDLDADRADGWINALGALDARLATDAAGVAAGLAAIGIDVVQTDRPAAFVRLFRERGLRPAYDAEAPQPCR